jgi:hypothetical protein
MILEDILKFLDVFGTEERFQRSLWEGGEGFVCRGCGCDVLFKNSVV